MTTRLEVSATWNSRMAFTGTGHTGDTVAIDYVPPLGEDHGIMPLELLLISLAACSGATVATLLGRMQQPLAGMEVRAVGERRDEHPTVFTGIRLEFRMRGARVDRAAVEKALALSETQLCPVWAMLKPTVPITASCVIEA